MRVTDRVTFEKVEKTLVLMDYGCMLLIQVCNIFTYICINTNIDKEKHLYASMIYTTNRQTTEVFSYIEPQNL